MAALCPGLQYGLSSQESFGENKDLIFVKLTDSALRAIEEYLKNKNKFSCQSPTIKFLGNEGQLAFPSAGSTASFSFSMSSTQDMEGPGGSFECLRQTGPPRGSLEVLGSIPYKIRVHANDDVYAATRQRMTVAEENHKNKCTREIKPNQTDIGRKVKVKQNPISGRSSTSHIPPRSSNEKSNPPHPSMRDCLLKQSYHTTNVPPKPNTTNSISNGMHHMSNGLSSNHNMSNSNHTSNNHISNNSHISNNHVSSNQVSSTRPPQNKPTTPDLLKRPIRERLIHLLAVKPYKKVELFERISKEGVREKASMSSVLKQIAHMKDNAYNLNRACWTDVRDNWPFYTENDRVEMRKRRPPNLTPPASDSGSSSSGQSPTSTHPGSPPQPTTTTSNTSSTKRPGYYDGADGFPTKRPRVSHYRKPKEPIANPPPIENKSQRRLITDSRDSSNMNPRSRESPSITTTTPSNNHSSPNGHFVNGYNNGVPKDKRSRVSDDDDEENVSSKKRLCDNYNGLSFDGKQERINDRIPYSNGYENKRAPLDIRSENSPNEVRYQNGELYSSERWINNVAEPKREKYSNNKYDVDVTSSNGNARVSPDSQSEPLLGSELTKAKLSSPYPDYLTEYTAIQNYEQRKRYKNDFNDNYAEYKDLHGIVEKVSRRFAELEERLKQEDIKSPRCKDIKKQIIKEYKDHKKNIEHQKAKQRFQYLHDKLSHIKQLVKEYDNRIINEEYQNDQY